MRLKYLELSGFKSFPNRTRIEFPEGICAIVGPNGCGKSNIVDAIRWVLGEQSPYVLRARSMEELLYSGKKKSCNLAWVRLLIEEKDPNNSMFPPELAHLSEIEIERQLWRSGESKYLLNKKVCRLKDIEYLFLDTGASRKSFAIIDQGKIGSIIEAGASQYKTLIEEIAGISRYKARRVQTQQKLLETSQNLERLKDIIKEVELQAKELEKQVKRCENFLSLKKEYEAIKLAILWFRYNDKNNKLSELYKIKEELIQKRDILNTEKQLLYKELTSLDARISEISRELDTLRSNYLDVQRQTSEKEIEINRLKSQLNILNNKLHELEQEIYRNKNKQNYIKRELEQLNSKKLELNDEKKTIKAKLIEINKEISNISTSQIEELELEIDNIKNELVQAESYIAKYNRENEFVNKQLNQLTIKKTRSLKDIESFSKDLENLLTKKGILKSDINKYASILDKNNKLINTLISKLDKLKYLLNKHKLQKEEIDFRYKKINQRLEQLTKEIDNKDDLSVGTRLLIENFKTCGLVADFIKVDKGVESFIELSIGELIEAVIFTDSDEFYRAVKYIKDKNFPSCNILFIKDFDPEETNFLVSYIEIDSQKKKISYHPQLDNLLTDKVKIKPLSDNISLSDIKNSNLIYITQDKHILVKDGYIFSFITSYKDGILSKKLLINELSNKKIIYQEQLDILKDKIKKIKQITDKQQNRLYILKTNNSSLEKELSEKKKNLELVSSQIDILKNRLEALRFEVDELDIQIEDFKKQINKINLHIKDKKIIKEQLAQDLDLKRKELASLKDRYNSLQREESKLRIILARLEEKYNAINSEIQSTISNEQRIIKRFKQISSEKDQILTDISALKNKIALEEDTFLSLKSKTDNYARYISQLEEELNKNKELFNKADLNLKEKSNQLSDIERKLNETELNISKLNFQINELVISARQQLKSDLTTIDIKQIDYSKENIDNLNEKLKRLANKIDNFGPINLEASQRYQEIDDRLKSLYKQGQDLEVSISNLKRAINEIDNTCKKALLETLHQINTQLSKIFPILFEGASAKLKVLDDSDILNAQFELSIKIPGKRIKHIGLLSGGEKALASMAFVFSLYLTKASPFCILDEIDAPLDQANIDKLNKLLELLSKKTQIILITHNQSVMEMADIIYGVTMEEVGVSKLICLPLKDIPLKEAQYA